MNRTVNRIVQKPVAKVGRYTASVPSMLQMLSAEHCNF